MRNRIQTPLSLLLTVAAMSALPFVALAQGTDVKQEVPRAELALDYSYLHSNAPPGGCGCFNLNGGSATFAWRLRPESSARFGGFSLVGDVTVAEAGTISSSGDSVTLSTFTAGGRYLPTLGHGTAAGHHALQPFGQALIGIAHSSGSLVEGSNPGAANAGAAFAANVGGGVDLRVDHRISIRLVEADYLLTTFDNGSNNHQNNLRISAGLVFHFGGK
jgi:outer membrane immunogenic protein